MTQENLSRTRTEPLEHADSPHKEPGIEPATFPPSGHSAELFTFCFTSFWNVSILWCVSFDSSSFPVKITINNKVKSCLLCRRQRRTSQNLHWLNIVFNLHHFLIFIHYFFYFQKCDFLRNRKIVFWTVWTAGDGETRRAHTACVG